MKTFLPLLLSLTIPALLAASNAVTTTGSISANPAVLSYSASVQPLALSATVASTAGPVTGGTVKFTLVNGTATMGGASGAVFSDGSGTATATFNVPAGEPVGAYPLTVQAVFSGSQSFAASAGSMNETLTINLAPTTTGAVSAAPSALSYSESAQPLTMSATVTSTAGPVNAGTVTFTVTNKSGNQVNLPVTSGIVSNGAAAAAFNVPAGLAVDTYGYSIQGVYSGSSSFQSSTSGASGTLTISPAQTTTGSVSVNPSSVAYSANAQPLTLSATVTSTAGPVSGGTVTFTLWNGTATIGSVSGTVFGNGSGTATASASLPAKQAVGVYTIQAAYSNPNNNFQPSSGSVTLTVTTKTLTVIGLSANNKPYDGTTTATLSSTGASLQGVASGDTVTLSQTGYTATFASAGVGNGLAVTVSGLSLSGTSASNYTLTQPTGLTANIVKATPAITWTNPAAITYGTALSATQLNAAASVQGSFVYTPASGTVLGTGNNQTLNAAFTPTDTVDYGTATGTASINVTATFSVTASPAVLPGSGTSTITASQPVTWALTPFGVGTLSTQGPSSALYSAPTSIGTTQTVTITADAIGNANDSQSAAILLAAPPTVLSVNATPASGLGATTFVLTVEDDGGYSLINYAEMILYWPFDISDGCNILYSQSANALYLASDAWSGGTGFLGGIAPGTPGTTISNSQCTLDVGASTVAGSGNTLTLNPVVTFQPAFVGPLQLDTYADDLNGWGTDSSTSGFYTAAHSVDQPPTSLIVTPSSGTGMSSSFTFHVSDANSYRYIFEENISFGSGCHLVVFPTAGQNDIFLASDDGTQWFQTYFGSTSPGWPTSLSNSQCTVNVADSSVTGSGNDLNITLAMQFTAGYAGAQSIAIDVTDVEGGDTGFQQVGSWTVGQVTPVITWANPAAITYGTALSATQLNATANDPTTQATLPGTFSYFANGTAVSTGTVLAAGAYSLGLIFTPSNTANYNTATAGVSINVLKATPVITWANPANITYGTPLSTIQLDATANVLGGYNYTPTAGTVLSAGNNQTLSVTFTPNDTTDYTTAAASVSINVVAQITLSPTSATANSVGGAGSFSVSASAGTEWVATDPDSWVHLVGASSGTGNGTVNYSLDPNATGASRTSTITVSGVAFSITQAPASVITYGYDALGRLTSVTDSINGTAIYSYDAVGNILSIARESSSQVSVTGFSPTSGPVGTTVTIDGAGFSATPGLNTVQFSGVAATVSSSTPNELVAIVPSGVTIASVSVTVNGISATSPGVFTVTSSAQPITITGFAPQIALPGSQIVITGTNFDSIAANNTVTFNGLWPATAIAATTTSLTVTVPANATSGKISIAVDGYSATSIQDFFVVPPGYTVSNVAVAERVVIGAATTLNITVGNLYEFIFDGVAGQKTSIVDDGPHLTDILYQPNGTPINVDTELDGQLLTQSGTYTLVVIPQQTGYLKSEIYNVPPDVVGTIAVGGPPVPISMAAPGQLAVLTFTGITGQQISLIATTVDSTTESGDGQVTMLDPNEHVLLTSDCPTCFPSNQLTLTSTGTYSINWSETWGPGAFALTLASVPDIVGTITPGGPAVTVTILAAGQRAMLTFSGTAGQRIDLTLLGYGSLVISTPDGSTLCAAVNQGCVGAQTLPTNGTYTITLSQTQTGTDIFTLYTVPPDISGTITTDGPPVPETLVPGQAVSLSFSGTSGQQISIVMSGPNGQGVRGTLTILNPDGTVMFGYSDPSVLGPLSLSGTTGTYILNWIQASDSEAVTFALYTVPPNVTGTIVPGGDSVPVTIAAPGQQAVLTFSGTAGQRINVGVATTPFYDGTKVSILSPDGATSTQVVYEGVSGVSTLGSTGTYTITWPSVAAPWTGTAVITLYNVPPDVTGQITVNGSPYTVSLSVPGQLGSLTFSVPASMVGQQATLHIANNSFPQDLWVSVHGPDESGTAICEGPGSDCNFDGGPFTLPSPGPYTVLIIPDSSQPGNYASALTGSVDVSVTSP